jgi:hypothetical protein
VDSRCRSPLRSGLPAQRQSITDQRSQYPISSRCEVACPSVKRNGVWNAAVSHLRHIHVLAKSLRVRPEPIWTILIHSTIYCDSLKRRGSSSEVGDGVLVRAACRRQTVSCTLIVLNGTASAACERPDL